MLLVGPVVPVLPVTGVMITGNDAGKALRLQAYYEATDSGRTLFAVRMRECKRNGCDGRCLDGGAFGRGFDSRQVHMTKVRFGQCSAGKSDFFYCPEFEMAAGCQLSEIHCSQLGFAP